MHQTISVAVIACGLSLLSDTHLLHAADHPHDDVPAPTSQAKTPAPARSAQVWPEKLPKLPKGVTELKFSDFFVMPVGPRGLDLTDKLRSLNGKRVRILGYMAHRPAQPAGSFLLTPFPVEIHDHDNSLAEDFPVTVVQVSSPSWRGKLVPYSRGLMLLTGVLSVGNQAEIDGRVSLVRLDLDSPTKMIATRPAFDKRTTLKGAEMLRCGSATN